MSSEQPGHMLREEGSGTQSGLMDGSTVSLWEVPVCLSNPLCF